MAPSLAKVVYQHDTQSTEEYIVIVHPEEFKKWKDGDTTIALAGVVDSFKIFHSSTGSQGLLHEPSKQQLDTVFGTHKDVDVVEHILKNGKVQQSDGFKSGGGINIKPNPPRR